MNMGSDYFTLILDVIIIIGSLGALYLFRPRIGGTLSVGLRMIMVGVFILGLTHLADSIVLTFSLLDPMTEHWVHHTVNYLGYIVIFIGFFQMKRAVEA
jgi:hypothetical protein